MAKVSKAIWVIVNRLTKSAYFLAIRGEFFGQEIDRYLCARSLLATVCQFPLYLIDMSNSLLGFKRGFMRS